MLVRSFVIAALVAACADGAGTDEPSVLAVPESFAEQLCEFSLVGEGPCSLACDPEALIDTYVPAGECIAFECQLIDGTTTRVGGCNL